MNRKQIYRLLLFTGILYLAAASANAQIIKGEIIAGFNLSQLDGDEVYGYKKAGLQLGLGAMIPISEKWDISLETLYNEKGANEKAQYPMQADSTTGAYRVKLNYLDVPLLLHFTDKEFITVGTGFSWGRLIKAEEFEHGKQTNTTAQNGVYNLNDFNVLLDLRMRLHKQFKINFRYQYSISKIREREFITSQGNIWSRKQYNNMLTLRLVYVFNEERSQQNLRNP
ncbi:MAG: PorT family protein [Bacteroidetes bacterium]|jgi:hypothetical protein|nr:PorT family protein [Bacteroidota bacterium]MBU1580394.1 PorT family protein [Bacteroidota bacterium]MBU2557947.1 PorT family protein [Bacteroidota bacterium]MDA3942466.1 porin family protein [Bacteroidota bacterium]